MKWEPSERLEFAAFDHYFEGMPKFRTSPTAIVPGGLHPGPAAESGQIDVAFRLPVTEIQRLAGNKSIGLITTPTIMTMYVALNNQRGRSRIPTCAWP